MNEKGMIQFFCSILRVNFKLIMPVIYSSLNYWPDILFIFHLHENRKLLPHETDSQFPQI